MKPIVIGLSAMCVILAALVMYGLFEKNWAVVAGAGALLFSIFAATMFSLGMWFVIHTNNGQYAAGAELVLRAQAENDRWDQQKMRTVADIYKVGLGDQRNAMSQLPAPTEISPTVQGDWLELDDET